ncbi:flagellar basal body rod protein FlgC [Gammaproteobacteria bacterium 45_16_T64]|nr:flagellar basal body rod protein FlgC [Gammaproteobacteria bacterium 45_16_T64]
MDDSIFAISQTGLDFQRLRMEVIATNLANANTTRTDGGKTFTPLEVVASTSSSNFGKVFDDVSGESMMRGIDNVNVIERDVTPRMKFDPAHPDADAQGFVHMPAINPINEMTNLVEATRAYEANIKVMSAAKSMAARALEIGE